MTQEPTAATTTRPHVTAVLLVDLGRCLPNGTWTKQPRARYECARCHTAEGPVTGQDRVREFVARIRTDHPTYCTANEGAQAA